MSVFHQGEIAVQERARQRAAALKNGRIIFDIIPAGARPFLARQRMIAMAHGELWASIVFGDAGFVSSEDGSIVLFDHDLPEGSAVGLLAIEFETRRRLRVNGVALSGGRIRVREAYPNCPKYVQRRQLVDHAPVDGTPVSGTSLDRVRWTSIAGADTLFVASRHPERGMDASHRGGRPGFVQVHGDVLTVPDYPGNGMFNTLGNFEIDSAAGVTVLDFDRRRVLEMTGSAAMSPGADDPAHPTEGAMRFWTFTVREWRESPVPCRWDFLGASPDNP